MRTRVVFEELASEVNSISVLEIMGWPHSGNMMGMGDRQCTARLRNLPIAR
jgi:hypothetical protein